MEIHEPVSLLTLVVLAAAVLVGFLLGVLIFSAPLPERTPEERLAWDNADCQGLAGIQQTTPAIYAYTKDNPYKRRRYQECMRQRGYREVPPLP